MVLYHRISAEPAPGYPPLHPDTFSAHLDLLGELFEVLPLAELVERLGAGRALQGCCSITFDDGYRDFVTDALPIIEAKGVPVTHFLVADSVSTGRPPWNARLDRLVRHGRIPAEEERPTVVDRLSRMRWSDRDTLLCEWEAQMAASVDPLPEMIGAEMTQNLLRSGVEVGSHTRSHAFLTRIPASEARWEMAESRRDLEELCGRSVRLLSYPQGMYDASVEALAKEVGYDAAFAVDQRRAKSGEGLFSLPRFDVTDRPPWMLRMELSGLIPWLRRRSMR